VKSNMFTAILDITVVKMLKTKIKTETKTGPKYI
jgi:hypothetical protein